MNRDRTWVAGERIEMLDWRRGTGVVVAVMGLAGCFSGNSTSPTEETPAVSLVGPTWRLVSISGQAVVSGTTIDAEFSTDERVAGTSGCNRYFGSAKAEAGRISMGPFGATLMACSPDSVMTQEASYLATLGAAKSYTISGDELRLGPSASEATLVFTSR
jgi:heat shock protein HslJ